MTTRKTQPNTYPTQAGGRAVSTGASAGIGAVCVNRDALLENFAAELAHTAYHVALRTGTRGTWLDLELDLWRALADTVRTWEGNCLRAASR